MKKIDRIGESKLNNFGSKMAIIEYKHNRNVTVQFEDGYKIITQYSNFIKGQVANPFNKTVLNIGYI